MKIFKYILSIAFIALLRLVSFAQNGHDLNNNGNGSHKSVEISDTLKKTIDLVLCRLSDDYIDRKNGSFCKNKGCYLGQSHEGIYVDKYKQKVISYIQKSEPKLENYEQKANYLTSTLFENINDTDIKKLGKDKKNELSQIRIELLAQFKPQPSTQLEVNSPLNINNNPPQKNEKQESYSWILYCLLGASIIVNIVLLILFRSKKIKFNESVSNLERKNINIKNELEQQKRNNDTELSRKNEEIRNLMSEKNKGNIPFVPISKPNSDMSKVESISPIQTRFLYFGGFDDSNQLVKSDGKQSYTEGESIYKIEILGNKITYQVCEESNTLGRVKINIRALITNYCDYEGTFNSNSKIRTITPGTLTEAHGVLTISTKAKIRYE